MNTYQRTLAAISIALFALFEITLALAQQGTGQIPNGTNAGQFGPPISTNNGNISFGNGAPPVANAACGTGATVAGTDSNFRLQSGTSSNSGCQVAFVQPFSGNPICSVVGETALISWSLNRGNGINFSGVVDSSVYHVHCFGRPGG